MKSILLVLLSLPCILPCAYGQQVNTRNLWNGPGKFILGSDRNIYGRDIQLNSSDTTGAIKSYEYLYLPIKDTACILAGVPFNTIILSFDKRDKLQGIDMIGLYKKTDTTAYFKNAQSDVKKLIPYLKSNLHQQAVLKNHSTNENSNSVWYEWKKKASVIYLQAAQNKYPGAEGIILSVDFGHSGQ